jgi:hypothetical protein
MSNIYFPDIKSKAVFAADGPKPQFLIETPQFKMAPYTSQNDQDVLGLSRVKSKSQPYMN